MPDDSGKSPGVQLARVMLVVVTGVFVTVLIITTGDLEVFWPLYLVPIVIAALAFHVAGAILAAAVSTALLALLTAGVDFDPAVLPELIVGMVAFFVSGLVIGAQSQRSTRHGQLLEEASILDPLTGLFKAEYLNERLAEELRRSERYGLDCSIVLITVNDFEEFKTQFGHYKAEVLLEHLADILRVTVRSHDIIARYGHTAYCIVLPLTDASGAEAAAERIREAVAAAEFEGDVIEPVTHCTVTAAIATYPEDALRASELTDIVNQRLDETVSASETSAREGSGAPADASAQEGAEVPDDTSPAESTSEPEEHSADEGTTDQGDTH